MPTLSFKGKTAIESHHLTVPHHVFDFDKKLSLTKKPSLDGNLIIEGDNLLALKSLLPTHAGKVKCIYIDPPYNTGNEQWVYNDNLTQPQFKDWIGKVVGKEGEDFTRHDKWCCMMYPRLQLLKELLRDDGAIFVSIDDNELCNLLFLCDEVFGDNNRFARIVVKNNPRGRRLGTELAVEHEYLVVYAKSIEKFTGGKIPLTEEQIGEYSEVAEDGRKYRLLGLRKRGALSRRVDRPNLHFAIYVDPSTGRAQTERGAGLVEVLPMLSDGSEGVWRWRTGKVDDESERLIAKQVKRRETGVVEWDVFEMDYLDESDGRLFPSIWEGSEFNNETGTDQINEVLGKGAFAYPKPVDLVKHAILLSGTTNGDLILDSFAGSGTTAQAVIELNNADSGNCRFILVQMPHETKEQEQEKFNICQKITAERVRRVMNGYSYKNQKSKRVEVDGRGGEFAYARIGQMLFDQFRNFAPGKYPSWEELARYIFYTETTTAFDAKKLSKKTGKIGEHGKRSYYLLYEPNDKADAALTRDWLAATHKRDPGPKVVYCEKIWMHREELDEEEKYGKVRAMVIPFNLK